MKAIIVYFAFCVIFVVMIALIRGWDPITGIPHIGFWPYLFQ